MAEEFKFPDEIDDIDDQEQENLEVTAETDGDDLEIVIEDDTPEEDRGVEPLPDEIKQELETVDKSKEYSKNVKDKFTKYKKAWHDERRAKEAAYREQQEALRIAQQMVDENNRLKQMIHSGEKELISNYQVSAELELDKAKTNYREAYDSGDPDRLIAAQEEMFRAQIKLDKAKNFRPTVQNVESEVQIPQQRTQQPAQTDDRVAEWVADNKWFVDPKKAPMRRYAEAYHSELESTYGAGFVGTEKYYEEIDAEMRRRFPEEFGDKANADEAPKRTKPSTVVAPARRSTSSKKVVLNKSQMATIKKLGISPEQYVREQMKLES
jgi:hypothetical protein